MKYNIKNIFIYFEKLLIFFYSLIIVGFILDIQNILVEITSIASQMIIWPLFSNLSSVALLVVVVLYYLILFAIPITGYLLCKKEYLIIHTILALLIIINLLSFFYGLNELSKL